MGARIATELSVFVSPPSPPGVPPFAYLTAVLAERRRRDQVRLGAAGRRAPPSSRGRRSSRPSRLRATRPRPTRLRVIRPTYPPLIRPDLPASGLSVPGLPVIPAPCAPATLELPAAAVSATRAAAVTFSHPSPPAAARPMPGPAAPPPAPRPSERRRLAPLPAASSLQPEIGRTPYGRRCLRQRTHHTKTDTRDRHAARTRTPQIGRTPYGHEKRGDGTARHPFAGDRVISGRALRRKPGSARSARSSRTSSWPIRPPVVDLEDVEALRDVVGVDVAVVVVRRPGAAADERVADSGPRSKKPISFGLAESVKSQTETPPWYHAWTMMSRPWTGISEPLCATQFSVSAWWRGIL